MAYSAPVRGSSTSTHRRIRYLMLAAATVLALVAGLLGTSAGRAQAASTLLSQGQPTTASSQESGAYPAPDATDGNTGTRWSSAFSDPQWLQVDLGSAVDDQPGGAQLGVRLRDLVPDPDLGRRVQLDLDLLDHHRPRRHPDAERDRQRPLRPHVRHGPGHRLRLLLVGIPGVRHQRLGHRQFLRHHQRGPGPARHRVLDRERGLPGQRRGGREHRHPLVQRGRDPQWLEVDLGSAQPVCQVALDWEAAYATAFQIQVSTDGTNWTTIYSTTTGTGGTQTLTVTGTGRYVRMYGTARATGYGYSPVGVRHLHRGQRHRRRRGWRR